MMKRTLLVPTLAVAVVLLGTTTTRADLISWGYNWAPVATSVTAGTGYVSFTNELPNTAQGNSNIVATNLGVFSMANPGTPDTFAASGANDGEYTLKINLTDPATSATGTLMFTGQLQGSFSQFSANITNTFTGLTTQSIDLGDTHFVVTMDSYTPPGPPGSVNHGSIAAFVEVSPRDHLAGVPEPSTMALAGIGVGLAGLAAWRRRRRAAA
jgi:hypothetical protein